MDYRETLEYNVKGVVKIINEKEAIVFFSFFNRYIPVHYYLKSLTFSFQGEHIFICTLSVFPSLLSLQSACQTILPQIKSVPVVSGRSTSERAWNSECHAVLPAVGLDQCPKPVEL